MELSVEYLPEKLQWDLEAEHVEVEDTTPTLRVQLPSLRGVSQVRGEAAASETPACEHLPSRRAPAHPCL